MKRLPRPKLVFWFRKLRTLSYVMAFLVTVLTYYLTQVLWGSISTIIRVVGDGINQVYTNGRGFGGCMTQLSIATIVSGSLKIPARGLVGLYRGSKLTINQLGFFFFVRLGGFLFLIGSTAFSVTSIHLSNLYRGLECSLKLGLNSLIKQFVLEV